MDAGINIEAPRFDAEAGAALAGAIGEILQIGADTRTSESVMLAAFDVMRHALPSGRSEMSISHCNIDGREQVVG